MDVDGLPNVAEPFFPETCALSDGRENSILDPRDQQETACCYGLVAVDAIFAAQFLKEGQAEKGSEQDYMDNLHIHFPPKDAKHVNDNIVVGPRGLGNRVINAFEYAKNYGLALESDWPFVGKFRGTREDRELYEAVKQTGKRIFLTRYHKIDDDDHATVCNVLDIQPVAASVPGADSLLQWKPSMGVYQGPTEKELERKRRARENGGAVPFGSHAILLIGYGVDSGGCEYYVAKNSKGPDWGFKGYVKIARKLCTRFVYPEGYKLVDMAERKREKERKKEEKEKGKAKKQQQMKAVDRVERKKEEKKAKKGSNKRKGKHTS